jgi:hypothetical protein
MNRRPTFAYITACTLMMQASNSGPILIAGNQDAVKFCRELAQNSQVPESCERVRVLAVIETETGVGSSDDVIRDIINRVQEQAEQKVLGVPSAAAVSHMANSRYGLIASTSSFDEPKLEIAFKHTDDMDNENRIDAHGRNSLQDVSLSNLNSERAALINKMMESDLSESERRRLQALQLAVRERIKDAIPRPFSSLDE